MDRRTWVVALVVVAALVVVVGTRAMAQDGDDDGGPRTITVTATATVGSEPDQATLRLGVSTRADESSDALNANGRITDRVLAALADAGVAEDDVRTERLDVNQRTIHRRTPQERRVYVADAKLGVTVRDLDSVGAVIEAAVDAGATSVRDVRFEVSDPSAARTGALEQAVEGSRTKADAMAAAAGTSVAGVERVVEEGPARPYFDEFEQAAPAAFAVTDREVSIVPPSELDTSVTVTVVWRIG